MAILDGLSDVPSKVSEFGKSVAPLTAGLGFYAAVVSKFGGLSTLGTTNQMANFVAQLAGQGAAKAIFPSWSGSANQTFNLGAVINKETGLAIALYLLKDFMPNKYTRLLYNVAFPPLAGYGIGKIFDDPPMYNTGQMGAGVIQGNSGTWLPQESKGGWN